MALTFGTLLSSQGADAHRRGSFEPFRGNPSYATRSVPLESNHPSSAQLPTWSPHTVPMISNRGASRLGDVRSGPTRSPPGYPADSLWLRAANKENISQRPQRESNPLVTRVFPSVFGGSSPAAASIIQVVRGAETCDLGHPVTTPPPSR